MDPQVSPNGTTSESNTVPEKRFNGVTVMVDVVDTPTFTAVGDVEAMVKSLNCKRALAEWVRELALPVSVRV